MTLIASNNNWPRNGKKDRRELERELKIAISGHSRPAFPHEDNRQALCQVEKT